MKKQLAVLSFVVAGLVAVPSLLRAEDAVPPKPPGGDKAPADANKPAGDAGARRGGGAGRFSPEERLKRMTEELNLTQDQQDKVKAIMAKGADQMKEIMAKGRENLSDDDKAKVREFMKSQFDEISAVLTPEQKEKYKEAMEKRRAQRGGGAAK